MNSEELLCLLSRKSWRAEKTISDLLHSVNYQFGGELEFKKNPDGSFLSDERGTIVGPQGSYESSKRYFYRPKSPSVIDVLFENKSFFHSLECDLYPRFQIHHHCGDDLYTGSYEFDLNAWSSSWQVTGPAKNYILRARYK